MGQLSVLGSGVVGRATGIGLFTLSHTVTFIDIDEDRIASLRAEGLDAQHADQMTLSEVSAIFVAVPTPANDDGIETGFLDAACKTLGRLLQSVDPRDEPPLIVFRSTMPPGTTRTRLIPALETHSGQRCGADFLACYNPEYLRAYNAVEDFLEFKLLTFGGDAAGEEACARMRTIFDNFAEARVTELTYEEAEYQKYVHNVFNAMKISYFNEMRQAAEQLGLDNVEQIFSLTAQTAEAAWNPAYGTRDQGPFGGACLPKDTAAWVGFSRRQGITTRIVDAAREVNIELGGQPC